MARAKKPDEFSEGFGCGPCPKCGLERTVRPIHTKVYGMDHPFKWFRDPKANIHDPNPGRWVEIRCHCDSKRFERAWWRMPRGVKKKLYGCGYEGSCLEFRRKEKSR